MQQQTDIIGVVQVLQKAVHFPSYARVFGHSVMFGERGLIDVPKNY